MRTRTYQNAKDKVSGSFHVQVVFDPDEAKAVAKGDKEKIAELQTQVKEATKQ
jgi:hypothetical protein